MSENEVASVGDGNAVHVRWIMPEGFYELPMDVASIDELADELIDVAQRVMPGVPEDILARALTGQKTPDAQLSVIDLPASQAVRVTTAPRPSYPTAQGEGTCPRRRRRST
ncbi:hypothetical protein [Streptomyces fumanus]|uniref:hypothetical protein n=1 Tax=Streptomyces fumanus TaxID=67302 RepID=UPI0033C43B09